MKTATLYTVTAAEVPLVDGFTHSRSQSGGYVPAHSLGTGNVLVGVPQQPMGAVFVVGDGRYVSMAPELRQVLEAPILCAAEGDAARRVAEVLQELAGRPLLARLWWALAGDCSLWEWLAARVRGAGLRGA